MLLRVERAGVADELMLPLESDARSALDGDEEESRGEHGLLQQVGSGLSASIYSSFPMSSVTLRMSPLEAGW